MNILQINSVCGIGSTGRIATDLHAILLSQRHQSTVAYGRNTAKNCEQSIRIGNRIGNYLHAAQTRLLDKHGFGSYRTTKTFISKIRNLNPDVIHLHNLHGYYIHIGVLFDYLKQANKPVVWTLHDCWAFTGHCSYFDFVDCDCWKTQCCNCPLKNEYPKSFFLDRSRKNYSQKKELFTGVQNLTIVTPSKWLANSVKQSFLQQYPITIINNGIDLSVFQPVSGNFRTRYGLENKFLILGVASIFDKRKGFQYFLDLSKKLKKDERIVLVGLSEKQIRQLPSWIIGIVRTNNVQELAGIYSTADLFVNPTLEDNFPTTNLEALACGIPVVTFNSGGSPECIDKGCGLVVKRGDLPGLISAIEAVRKNGKKFYSAHCQKRAKDLYDKNARFYEYVELYRRCMNLCSEALPF